MQLVYITQSLGSIGVDHVISELCYKGIILQRNYRFHGHFPVISFFKILWLKFWEPQHDHNMTYSMLKLQ